MYTCYICQKKIDGGRIIVYDNPYYRVPMVVACRKHPKEKCNKLSLCIERERWAKYKLENPDVPPSK